MSLDEFTEIISETAFIINAGAPISIFHTVVLHERETVKQTETQYYLALFISYGKKFTPHKKISFYSDLPKVLKATRESLCGNREAVPDWAVLVHGFVLSWLINFHQRRLQQWFVADILTESAQDLQLFRIIMSH